MSIRYSVAVISLVMLTAGLAAAWSAGAFGEGGETGSEEHRTNGFDGMPPIGTRAVCPVMKNEFHVDESTTSSVVRGKTYVFCCPGCKPEFEKDTDVYLGSLAEQRSGEEVSEDRGDAHSRAFETTAITVDPVIVQNMGVRVSKVERGQVYRNVRALGEVVVAQDEVFVVNLRYSGWVERVYVGETERKVDKGEPLFSIYSPEVTNALEDYISAASKAEGSGALAASTERRLALMGIGKGQLRRALEKGKAPRTVVVAAPGSGHVLHKNVVEGARVRAGEDLYRIGVLGRVWVEAQVYEHDAPWIELGQTATVDFSSGGGQSRPGIVQEIYPRLNPRTRSLTVRLELDNPGLELRPGTLATVRIETRHEEDVITVPSEAVIHSGEERLVFVAEGYGRYRPREVATGLVSSDGKTEIFSGVTPGEEVVVSGQFLLDSESRLKEAVAKMIEEKLQADDGSREHEHSGEEGNLSYFTCPMHPEVVRDGPGTCPQCGMDLVEKSR